MIESLSINNMGVIENAHVDLRPGFTVVTGETGAGKTMFVSALNLLTGTRAETQAVRTDASKAVVEGIFSVDSQPEVVDRVEDAGGSVDDGELVVTRTIPTSGRARATAGGRTVPIAVLSQVGEKLVSMHGQSEQLTLRSASKQRELLDTYGGENLARVRDAYVNAFEEWKRVQARAQELHASEQERNARIEYLEGALAHIDRVRPVDGEDQQLKGIVLKLEAADDVKQTVQTACDMLVSDGFSEAPTVVDLLHRAADHVNHARAHDEAVKEQAEALTALALSASDVASELSAYLASFAELDDVSLEDTHTRIAQLAELEQYGDDVEAVLEFETKAGEELLQLRADSSDLAGIDEQRSQCETSLHEHARALTEARTSAARDFTDAVQGELTALSMPHARVVFDIEPTEPGPHGADTIRLLFSAHGGTAPGDISKLASGGELSRVMLAIEVVIARAHAFPTFIFDEVDSGVGGAAATEIGRRLALLARHSQVIVVTHLAQVAAWADTHLVIRKDDSNPSGAVSGVTEVADNQRETELARMLGGVSDSPAAREHATELIQTARAQKQGFVG